MDTNSHSLSQSLDSVNTAISVVGEEEVSGRRAVRGSCLTSCQPLGLPGARRKGTRFHDFLQRQGSSGEKCLRGTGLAWDELGSAVCAPLRQNCQNSAALQNTVIKCQSLAMGSVAECCAVLLSVAQ